MRAYIRFLIIVAASLPLPIGWAIQPTELMKAVQVTGEITFRGDSGMARLVIRNSGDAPVVIEQIFAGRFVIPAGLSIPPRKEVTKEYPCPDGSAKLIPPLESTLKVAIAARGVNAPVEVGEISVHLPAPETDKATSYFHPNVAPGAHAVVLPLSPADRVASLNVRMGTLENSISETRFIALLAVLLAGISGGLAMRRK